MRTLRDSLSRLTRKEVRHMADHPSKGKQPDALARSKVRITAQYLRQRGKIGMTLTKAELEHVAELIRAGRVITKDYREVSKNLRQAMTKLGIDTRGL